MGRTDKPVSATPYFEQNLQTAGEIMQKLVGLEDGDNEDAPMPMDMEPIRQPVGEQCEVLSTIKPIGGTLLRLEDLQKVRGLGHGASGDVDMCIHVPSQTYVAVKVLRAKLDRSSRSPATRP